jgi:hypothetical protein
VNPLVDYLPTVLGDWVFEGDRNPAVASESIAGRLDPTQVSVATAAAASSFVSLRLKWVAVPSQKTKFFPRTRNVG